ncbi:haf-6 [Pristionchus pacificus]|uniref:Mitochondrial potassium channel ATP-binding subunit n=1 Tax=Pristionchus pacificus TaxID=54126 RepID=A0A2A6BYJ8_PRIPA|nr:haf-6 [Pristionchus pacificus]|eukprot:PDM70916.1 ABC transporter ATP-binding protein [Pristionchus pacificus]
MIFSRCHIRVFKFALNKPSTNSLVFVAKRFSTFTPIVNSLRTYLKRPLDVGKVLKSLRLSGLALSISAVPFARVGECKNISRRVDHLIHGDNREAHLSLRDLASLIAPHAFWLVVAVIAAFMTALLNIQIPLYLGELIDAMAEIVKEHSQVGRASLAPISPVVVKLVASYAAQAGLTFLYITFLSILGERMAGDLRLRLFHRLLHLDMSFFDAEKTTELSSRLNVDVQEFKSSFKITISQGLRTLTQVVGCMWSLCRISPRMTLFTMAIIPMVITIGAFCGLLLRSLSRRAQCQSTIASTVSDEALSNIRTVRAFAMEQQELRLFSREVEKATVLHEALGAGVGLFQGGTNLLLNGIVVSVLYGGSGLIAAGELSAGDLMSFLVTAQTIQKSLAQLSITFGTALKGYTAGARVIQFANIAPSESYKGGIKIPYHSLWGEICFEGVHFTYPSRPEHTVLNGLNLRIPAGQVVALCGPSGEGKSTMVSLLERFYEPNAGRITLDGKDLTSLDVQWLRGQTIGLISQEPVLFATSIAENIRYGAPGASDEEVERAAKLANADSFIQSFPNGYNTIVGERGAQLSGGQRQRIAIARALVKDPPILILDEATSALDTESERLVKSALDTAMKGRTVLVIAHRLSTIQSANKICVIRGGKVVEEGTHEELMKKKTAYATLIASTNS